MEALSTESRTLTFFDHGIIMGKLVYPRRFSSNADLVLQTGEVYAIESMDLWKSRYQVSFNGKPVVSISKKWTGNAVMTAFHPMMPGEYTFRQKGFFNIRYILADRDQREMLTIRTRFIWKGLKYNYLLELSDSMKRREGFFILTALTTYLARMSVRQHSA